MLNFEQENKILANKFLEDIFYSHYRKGEKQLEIFLQGVCSANCEYCYLKKHQKDLYPTKIHNEEIILQNLQKTLNWYVANKFRCKIDIFSGNWINTPIGPKVFDIFYNTFSKVEEEYRPITISMPDNMQFLKDPIATKIVEDNIARFAALRIPIWFSASVDGYFCEYGRTPGDEIFYKNLVNFLTKYKYLPHPMISSNNIQDWIKNYQWWRNTFPKHIVEDLMTLEVRDNTWTDETISQLVQYCDFLIDYKFTNDYNENKIEFLKYILNLYPRLGEQRMSPPYNIIGLTYLHSVNGQDKVDCGNSENELHIRMGDLSVGLCHRLYYPELQLGQFNTNDTQITDFEPTNVSLLISYKKLNKTCLPYCEECLFQHFCPGHCHGASYESIGNPLVPNKEVCQLYQSKFSFLVYKYYTLGLFDTDMLQYLKSVLLLHEYDYLIYVIKSVLSNMNIEIKEE